jgi:hypothetical protein
MVRHVGGEFFGLRQMSEFKIYTHEDLSDLQLLGLSSVDHILNFIRAWLRTRF